MMLDIRNLLPVAKKRKGGAGIEALSSPLFTNNLKNGLVPPLRIPGISQSVTTIHDEDVVGDTQECVTGYEKTKTTLLLRYPSPR